MSTLTEKIPSAEKIPAPVFALVGVTDAAATLATHAAQAVNERIAAMERPSSDDAKSALKLAGQQAREQARTSVRSIDLTKVDPRKVDLTKADPRNLELPKVDLRNRDLNVELPKIDLSTAAAYAFELAAAVEKKYDEMVVRGERILAELRGEEHVTAPSAEDLVDLVEPVEPVEPVKPVKATKPATKKATKPVKKAAPQAPAAEKSPESTPADHPTQD